MGRIRTIKPEFFQDEHLAELSPLHRLLFIGLWTEADRDGRLEDRPQRLKPLLLAYDEADVDRMLQDLADHPKHFVLRYKVEGRSYIEISRFTKHQRPNSRESMSSIPPSPKRTRTHEHARSRTSMHAQEREEGKGREWNGREREREGKGKGAGRGRGTDTPPDPPKGGQELSQPVSETPEPQEKPPEGFERLSAVADRILGRQGK